MKSFIMKALTLDNKWYAFGMQDAPTRISPDVFVLFNSSNTPKLQLKSIRRGCKQYNLFEGDVIEMDGSRWIICYERGFYAINENYIVRYLNTLHDYTYLGDMNDIEFPIPIALRGRHLFKYHSSIFRFEDITGSYDNKLILRSESMPIKASHIQQECCMCYEGRKIFLGDKIGDSIVKLFNGRIVLKSKSKVIDLATGGTLDYGCVR